MRLGKDTVRDLAARLGKCATHGYVFSVVQVNEKLMAQDFEIHDFIDGYKHLSAVGKDTYLLRKDPLHS